MVLRDIAGMEAEEGDSIIDLDIEHQLFGIVVIRFQAGWGVSGSTKWIATTEESNSLWTATELHKTWKH